MAQKNASPGKAQAEILKRNKLNPLTWVVTRELDHSLIVMHRITGEFKCIDKQEASYGKTFY